MADPITLTDEAFTGSRLIDLNRCTMVVVHADLATTTPEDGGGHSAARDLMNMALCTTDDVPEMQIGLLNCLDYPETAEKLSVYVSEFGTQCAVLIFTSRPGPHFIAAGADETPASFHHWVLGILLAFGYQPTVTREEIVLRLAYDLAQPPEFALADDRWDDVDLRTRAIRAVRETLKPLYEAWIPGFAAEYLE
jgi:hypothetical protein